MPFVDDVDSPEVLLDVVTPGRRMVFSRRNAVCTVLLAQIRASAMALLVAASSRQRGIELAGSLPITFNGVGFLARARCC
jgi:hypothetical protein